MQMIDLQFYCFSSSQSDRHLWKAYYSLERKRSDAGYVFTLYLSVVVLLASDKLAPKRVVKQRTELNLQPSHKPIRQCSIVIGSGENENENPKTQSN